MGTSHGVQSVSVKEDNGFVKCVSETKYKKFPRILCKSAGALLLEIVALPKQFYSASEPTNAYWWMDAQFLPNDDTTIFITCGAFTPRTNHPWIKQHHIPVGRIMKFKIGNNGTFSEDLFPRTRMPHYPKIQMHPSGQYLGYVGQEAVIIETTEHEEVYNKYKDIRNCNYRFCAFSPNGKYIAILLSVSKCFEIILSKVDKGFAFHDKGVDLSTLVPGFKGSHAYNEHVECKWSPDSERIAVCSSSKNIFVLDKNLDLIVNIVTDILPADVHPSWSGTFDYKPSSYHQVMALGGSDRCLYIVDTDAKTILNKTDALSKDAIDSVLYHPHQDIVAVSFRSFMIYLVDPWDGQITFYIDMKFHCSNLRLEHVSVPAIMRLSFSSNGEQLVTSSCDGKMRIWQLPIDQTLFDMCKMTIIGCVPPAKLRTLPLPGIIIKRLLSIPNNS